MQNFFVVRVQKRETVLSATPSLSKNGKYPQPTRFARCFSSSVLHRLINQIITDMKPKSAAERLGLDPEYVKKLDEELALLESGNCKHQPCALCPLYEVCAESDPEIPDELISLAETACGM